MTHSDSEEEILIYAEFEDSVNIDKYRSIHVLGISEKNPIIQADDTFFTGKLQNPLGTFMFFEEDPSPPCSDPLFDKPPEKSLKYVLKTRKLLSMEHAYVTPKADSGQETNVKNELEEPDKDIELVNFKTLQEALDKFSSELKNNSSNEMNIDLNSTEDMQL